MYCFQLLCFVNIFGLEKMDREVNLKSDDFSIHSNFPKLSKKKKNEKDVNHI